MAKKVAKPQESAPNTAGADDLQILHPEVRVQVAGREVVVREYGFIEGLRLRPTVQPLLDDLYALMKGRSLELEQIIVVLGKHADLVAKLISIAADVDGDFLNSLTQRDGQLLMMAWWSVNGPFYLSALVDRAAAEQLAEQQARRHAGATSTPSSSPLDTETLPPSAD